MRTKIGGLALGVVMVILTATNAVAATLPGQAEGGDLVGDALAEGDFDGDGFDDLATGARLEAIGNLAAAGAVDVVYGSANGLTESGAQLWSQDSAGILFQATIGDQFGAALSAGDFDGDGFDDLAVGVPGEDAFADDTGVVQIIYGSATGLTATGSTAFGQTSPNIEGDPEAGDHFGAALAAGDFNSNGFDDLAIGVPDESIDGVPKVGAVNVIYGTSNGLNAAGDQLWHQRLPEILDQGEANDRFGFELEAEDFNADGSDDLAIGVPFEDVSGATDAGAVNVLFGSANRLNAFGNQFWNQAVRGGNPASGERYGFALAAANFGRTSHADLAIGWPGFDPVNIRDAGAVNVMYGSSVGLTLSGNQVWHQVLSTIAGDGEEFDGFGSALAAANFGNSSTADLAVGVPSDSLAGIDDVGMVNLIFGSSTGLTGTGDQLWHQNVTGIEDSAEVTDLFGRRLAGGNFGRTGHADLAVGVPFENIENPNLGNAGVVNVIYGASDGLTITGDQLWHQGIP